MVLSVAFSNDGHNMAVLARDHKIRLFDILTARIYKTIDESLEVYSSIQQVLNSFYESSNIARPVNVVYKQENQQLANMEFGRRAAIEKEIDRNNDVVLYSNLLFDESGSFLIYSTLLGIKSKSKLSKRNLVLRLTFLSFLSIEH